MNKLTIIKRKEIIKIQEILRINLLLIKIKEIPNLKIPTLKSINLTDQTPIRIEIEIPNKILPEMIRNPIKNFPKKIFKTTIEMNKGVKGIILNKSMM
jgi:hypothetical protein